MIEKLISVINSAAKIAKTIKAWQEDDDFFLEKLKLRLKAQKTI